MQQAKLELTIKAVLVGILLSLLLCGANIYLGLKIGNTISASIPASILAMGILRLFKNYSVLESNISQTIASAGEAIAAVIIFVFPALLILGTWHNFDYWSIFGMTLCGGMVGIIFSVMLRKVLLNDPTLSFPEGQAIGQVLLTTANPSNKAGLGTLLLGIAISAVLNFCQTGLQVFASTYYKIFKLGNVLIGGGTSFSAAIIGAGYLVGFNSGIVSLVALIVSWCILLPVFSSVHGIADTHDLINSAFIIWKNYIRPIGIGVMIFSGLATIVSLSKPICRGVGESIQALKNLSAIADSERDLNLNKLAVLLLIVCIPILIFMVRQLHELTVFSLPVNLILAIILLLIVLVLGFVIASVAGYFAGFVGSTNSPNSGLLFIAVIALSLILQLIVGLQVADKLAELFITIILLVSFIGFAACITNDNIQDFKSGQIVGAAPYKQQISLFFGVIAAAFVAPILINLIFQAYGIAGIIPHPGIDPNNTLSAPQASAIAMLTQNIVHHSQDWSLIVYGLGIGAIALIIDIIGKRQRKFRCPILSVGLGVYLPPDLVFALFLGGLLKLLVTRKQFALKQQHGEAHVRKLTHKTNLFICGLVAGESLMGLLLAIPFVIKQNSDALKIVSNSFLGCSQLLSALLTLLLLGYTYKLSQKA